MRAEKERNRQVTNEMFNHFEKRTKERPKSVIEFGCGYGRNLREAKKRYGCSITGLDIDKEAIEENKKDFNNDETTKFILADLSDGNFLNRYGNDEFDLGITSGFLMYIEKENKDKVIKQIHRICKNLIFMEISEKKFRQVTVPKRYSYDNYCSYSGLVNTGIILTSPASDLTMYVKGKK